MSGDDMAGLESQARAIFLSLVDRPQEEWPAALAALCEGRSEVRAKVERLLADHAVLGTVSLGAVQVKPDVPIDEVESSGTVIAGNYKLLEPLGEGGFGVVYLADQTAPVRRKVAIKILKPGMDTRQVVARFEAERQALAIMDHPNIARVFDGGIAPSGRPFFAMELVRGVPITEFCDQHRLNLSQRLELFVDVCQAVQHAHQKGIIHRDLKPSNVLVSRHDTTPVVKVIDFGVAKALGQDLTDKTFFTALTQMIGTPLYMSPEQAGMSDLDIDTRSDVYSLGVLLYELLTGTTPITRERFKQAELDELRWIIREEDPPKPSTRLSESTDTLPSVAANRGVEPRRLSGLLRGELDWIVMKALEKDRNRRYETASGFAADVMRYLAGEAVVAAPPSAVYRLRKFVRKHRALLSTTAAIMVLLVSGATVSIWQALRAIRAESHALAAKSDADREKEKALRAAERETEQRKKAEAKEAEAKAIVKFFEDHVFAAGRPIGVAGGRGHEVLLRDAVLASLPALATSFKDQPLVEARLRLSLGTTFTYLARHSEAIAQLERAHEIFSSRLEPHHPDVLGSLTNLAMNYEELERHSEALTLREDVVAKQRRILPKDHPQLLSSLHNLAMSYEKLDRHQDALKMREEVLAARTRVLGPDHVDTLRIMSNLALSYQILNRQQEALELREKVLEARRRMLGADHIDVLKSMNDLAVSYSRLNRRDDAIKLFQEVLAAEKRVLPSDHLETLRTTFNLGRELAQQKRYGEAAKLFEEALAGQKRVLPADHPQIAPSAWWLARCYTATGRHRDAVPLLEEVLASQKRARPRDDLQLLETMFDLANAFEASDRHDDARRFREEFLAQGARVLPADHPSLFRSRINLANSYHSLGRVDEAIKLREDTLAAMKRALPLDDPDLLRCTFNLAWGYWSKNRYSDALRTTDEFLAKADPTNLGPELIVRAIEGRLRCCQKLGDGAGCRKSAELFEKLGKSDALSLYNAACQRAVTAAVEAAAADQGVSRYAKEDADKAVALLQQAIAAGWSDAAHMHKDEDLVVLRSRDDFKKLLAELDAKAPPKANVAPPPQKRP